MNDFLKYDKTYFSKVTLPATTTEYQLTHFQQTGVGPNGNIRTPGQTTKDFALHKVQVAILSKLASAGAIAQANLDAVAKLIRGTLLTLTVDTRTVFEFPLTKFLKGFPVVATAVPTPANIYNPAYTHEGLFSGEVLLNQPVIIPKTNTFQMVQITNPDGTDLSALALEIQFAGFEFVKDAPAGQRA